MSPPIDSIIYVGHATALIELDGRVRRLGDADPARRRRIVSEIVFEAVTVATSWKVAGML
jgi:hypothetical protein